jgi:hypothetical protein
MSTVATGNEPIADQAAADALAQAAAKTGGEGAVKTAEQIAAETAVKPGETPKTSETPKEVVYALTIPKDAVIEASATERLTAFAKAHQLSPDVAQRVLEQANAEVVADRARQTEANQAAFQTLARETWPNEIKADKEFGGDKYDATVIDVTRAAAKFCTPEEKQILNETGWGNHPLLTKFFARVGRAMADDVILTGGGAEKPAVRVADLLYGNTKPHA